MSASRDYFFVPEIFVRRKNMDIQMLLIIRTHTPVDLTPLQSTLHGDLHETFIGQWLWGHVMKMLFYFFRGSVTIEQTKRHNRRWPRLVFNAALETDNTDPTGYEILLYASEHKFDRNGAIG